MGLIAGHLADCGELPARSIISSAFCAGNACGGLEGRRGGYRRSQNRAGGKTPAPGSCGCRARSPCISVTPLPLPPLPSEPCRSSSCAYLLHPQVADFTRSAPRPAEEPCDDFLAL